MTQEAPLSPGSSIATARRLDLPRLPVLGWSAFSGPKRSTIPSILDRDDICFTTSGRAAIALALRALGIGRGDRVLVPTYHCPTMVAPILAVGAEPVFFPIDATGAPIVEGLHDDRMQGVRAMIAAHYFGLPQPMATVRRFCDERGIALIEDCAHALFGQSDDRPVGRWGDFAIASLTKFLPVVDGGCLVPSGGLADLPPLRRQSMAIQLKSLANALELGARHRRLPGVQALLNGVFAAAAAIRRRPEDSRLRASAPRSATSPANGSPTSRPDPTSTARHRRGRDGSRSTRIASASSPRAGAITRASRNWSRTFPALARCGPPCRRTQLPTCFRSGSSDRSGCISRCALRAYRCSAGTNFGRVCRKFPAITASNGRRASFSSAATRICTPMISSLRRTPWRESWREDLRNPCRPSGMRSRPRER